MKRLSGFLLFSILCAGSLSQAMDMRLEQMRTKNFLSASAEYSKFTLQEGFVSGSGVKIDFNTSFSDKIALDIFLSSALNTGGGSSFTGLGGYMYYNLFGECCQMTRTLSVEGRPVLSEISERGQSFQLGIGLDQFFLNGSKSVYSASGLGLSALYQFSLFKYNFKAEARQSQMMAGQNKIQGSFFGLGMVFSL